MAALDSPGAEPAEGPPYVRIGNEVGGLDLDQLDLAIRRLRGLAHGLSRIIPDTWTGDLRVTSRSVLSGKEGDGAVFVEGDSGYIACSSGQARALAAMLIDAAADAPAREAAPTRSDR